VFPSCNHCWADRFRFRPTVRTRPRRDCVLWMRWKRRLCCKAQGRKRKGGREERVHGQHWREDRFLCSFAHKISKGRTSKVCASHSYPLFYHHHPIYRCLLTDLQSAEAFSLGHLQTPDTDSLLTSATHIYIEGFFLTHGVESATYVAKKASEAGKVRPFIPVPLFITFSPPIQCTHRR
jgi:hypothetical protein